MKNGINISLVIACDDEDAYANSKFMTDNDVPHIVRHFASRGTVILGKGTFQKLYDSFLPSKTQVVLTKRLKSKDKEHSSVYVPNTNGSDLIVLADSLEKSHAFARRLSWDCTKQKRRDVFILGGKSIFEQFLEIDWVDSIYLVQFYEKLSKNFGTINVDREWKTVDVHFHERYDMVKLIKRDRPLTEFDDPCE